MIWLEFLCPTIRILFYGKNHFSESDLQLFSVLELLPDTKPKRVNEILFLAAQYLFYPLLHFFN
jgi:hypothetical protein